MDQANANVNNMTRAVLWDVDGTLLDSAEYHWLSWRDTLADEGYTLTRTQFTASFGQRNDTILRDYFGDDFADTEIERIAGIKEERYRSLTCEGGVTPLPGVRHWLEYLAKHGWKQAVASSAPRLNVAAILAALEIEQFFDAVVSAEDVTHGKPDPQVFLTAANKLKVPPQRCIVIEDAPAGIEGAHRANMRAIGVRSSHQRLDGEIVVDTLDQLPPDAFERLIGSIE